MKKSKRVLSVVLTLAMIISLMSGLVFKTDMNTVEVSAKAANDYVVLEIVPNYTMAQFGYLVDGYEPVDMSWYAKSSNYSGADDFKTAVTSLGLGTFSGSTYSSSNLFGNLTAVSGKNVSVRTRTPNTVSQVDIDEADLIVINQTVASGLPTGASWDDDGINSASFIQYKTVDGSTVAYVDDVALAYEGKVNFTNVPIPTDKALAIFKKIAGAKGFPIPYFMDYDIYADGKGTDTTKYAVPYAGSEIIQALTQYGDGMESGLNSGSGFYCSDNVAYKLFVMLNELDPGTFYGLFFNNRGESYGLTDELSLLGLGYQNNGSDSKSNIFATGHKYAKWGEAMLAPKFLQAGNSNGTYSGFITDSSDPTTGWINDFSSYSSGKTYWIRNNYAGLTYISASGFLSSFESQLGSQLNSVITNFNATGRSDRKQYRFLVVSPNHIDPNINRSITENIMKSVDSNFVGLVGGVKVDCMSMYNFDAINKNLDEEYDCIIFTGNATTTIYSGQNNSTYLYASSGSTAYYDEKSSGWVNSTTSINPGNDLTYSKYIELIDFMYNKKRPIIIDNRLVEKSSGKYTKVEAETNMYNFLTKTETLGSEVNVYYTSDVNYSNVISDINVKNFDLQMISVPTIYDTISPVSFYNPTDETSYTSTDKTDADKYGQYINGKNLKFKTLEFSFFINSAEDTDYTVSLYIDLNSDGVYDEANYSSTTGSGELFKTWTLSSNTLHELTAKNKMAYSLPANYIGPVAWKLKVSGDDGMSVAKYGYSAIRSDGSDEGKQKVRILQVVPANVANKFANSELDQNDSPYKTYATYPFLLLPTKDEIKSAFDDKGSIEEYIYSLNDSSGTSLDKVKEYFEGVLTYDTASKVASVYNDNPLDTIFNSFKAAYYPSINFDTALLKAILRDSLDTNTINNNTGSGKMFADSSQVTSKCNEVKQNFSAFTGMDVINDDGLKAYFLNYTADQTVTEAKILANAGLYYYFMERQDDYDVDVTRISVPKFNMLVKQGQIKLDANGSISYPHTYQGEVSTYSCDLLMLGFGNNMDYMSMDAIDIVENYIKGGHNVFIGYGALSSVGNNTLCRRLRTLIGADRFNVVSNKGTSLDGTKSYDLPYTSSHTVAGNSSVYYLHGMTYRPGTYSNEGSATSIEINDMVVSHYPYSVPTLFRQSAGPMMQFQLDLEYLKADTDNMSSLDNSKRSVVCFAKNSNDNYYQNWGDARSLYYLYKRGNITVSALGYSSVGNDETGPRGLVMTLPESQLLVNTLLNASEKKMDSTPGRAWLDCKDPDHSSTPAVETGTKTWTMKDYVYVDYDGSQAEIDETSTPQSNTSTIHTEGGVFYRDIPYEAVAPTGGSLTIYKQGTEIEIPEIRIYSVNSDGSRGEEISPTSGNTYSITDGTKYIISVPLNDSAYTSATGLGLTYRDSFAVDLKVTTTGSEEVQINELNIVRRGLFLIN